MEVFFSAGKQMVVLFVLVVVGVVLRKIKLVDDRFETMLSSLVMNVALPAMILASVLTNEELPDAATMLQVFALSALVYACMLIVAELVTRLYRLDDDRERGAHAFMMVFGNVGFMGFPVIAALYGSQAVLYGAIYNIPFNIAAFSVGAMFIKRGGERAADNEAAVGIRAKALARSLVNPTTVVSLVSIALALLHVSDTDGVVGMSVSYLGQLTVPASMIVIGSRLATMDVTVIVGRIRPYISSVFKLVVFPLVIYLVLGLFMEHDMVLGIVTLGSAMPVASMGTMMCIVHNGDIKTMMSGTFITTVASLATIPLIAMVVM